MNRVIALLILVLAVWATGCAPAAAPGPATSSARVGGLWVGSLQSGSSPGPVELSLTQRGDQVGGTAEVTMRGDVLRGQVEARLSGATMQGSILGSSRTASMTLTLDGAVLKGSIAGSSIELRRQAYLAGSVYRSAENPGARSPFDPMQAP